MFGRLLIWYTIYTFSEALAPGGTLPGGKFTLRTSLAFSHIGSVTARHSSSDRQPKFAACYKEGNYRTFADGATYGWAAVTLGIGPHSSSFCLLIRPPGEVRSIAIIVSVCLSHTSKLHEIFCMCCLWLWSDLLCSDHDAICYVLPILLMSTCFHITGQIQIHTTTIRSLETCSPMLRVFEMEQDRETERIIKAMIT